MAANKDTEGNSIENQFSERSNQQNQRVNISNEYTQQSYTLMVTKNSVVYPNLQSD
jgi:hypothetical protein